jgi:hypothetical protein
MNEPNETCREILARFPDADAGDLSPERERETLLHLESCAECARLWREWQQAVHEAGAAFHAEGGVAPLPEGAPLGYWERFAPRVRRRIDADTRARRVLRRPAWAVPAAAALVLGFCLGAGVISLMPRPVDTRLVYVEPVDEQVIEVLEEMESYQENLLLPLSGGETWEDDLYDTVVDELDTEERLLLMEALTEEIS